MSTECQLFLCGRAVLNSCKKCFHGRRKLMCCIALLEVLIFGQIHILVIVVCAFSVGIYSEPAGEAAFLLDGQTGGVTHLLFSSDGTRLISGGRKVSLCYHTSGVSRDSLFDFALCLMNLYRSQGFVAYPQSCVLLSKPEAGAFFLSNQRNFLQAFKAQSRHLA